MRPGSQTIAGRILSLLVGLLILKIIAVTMAKYPDYFEPNFATDFLRGREGHFRGIYRWAFSTHILAGPVSLALGLILVNDAVRARFPIWHRRLGRVQVACVLLLVTPSGLCMAYRAAAGPIAAVGLALLAVATATCVSLGARAAMTRRFADHRRWMLRCDMLLGSAVVLRVMGGLATVAGMTAPWVDPLATWLCWIGPLAAFELYERASTVRRRGLTTP